MDRDYILAKIITTKALIDAYETAVTTLAGQGAIQSYTLDTGQSRQVVTRSDIPSLNRMLDSLYNRLATLEARLYGSSITARPGW